MTQSLIVAKGGCVKVTMFCHPELDRDISEGDISFLLQDGLNPSSISDMQVDNSNTVHTVFETETLAQYNLG